MTKHTSEVRKEFLRRKKARKKAEKERAQRNLDSLSRLGEVVGQMLADDGLFTHRRK
jgi:hypothetical protein|tara:strand:+ start:346 stop:516 length:171 start_codon:yes stop_codon:yes gene_type:complete